VLKNILCVVQVVTLYNRYLLLLLLLVLELSYWPFLFLLFLSWILDRNDVLLLLLLLILVLLASSTSASFLLSSSSSSWSLCHLIKAGHRFAWRVQQDIREDVLFLVYYEFINSTNVSFKGCKVVSILNSGHCLYCRGTNILQRKLLQERVLLLLLFFLNTLFKHIKISLQFSHSRRSS